MSTLFPPSLAGFESEQWRRERNAQHRRSCPHGAGTASRIRRILATMARMEAEPKKRFVLPKPTRLMKHVAPGLFRRAELRPTQPQHSAKIVETLVTIRKQDYARLDNGQVIRVELYKGRVYPRGNLFASIRADEVPQQAFPRLAPA